MNACNGRGFADNNLSSIGLTSSLKDSYFKVNVHLKTAYECTSNSNNSNSSSSSSSSSSTVVWDAGENNITAR